MTKIILHGLFLCAITSLASTSLAMDSNPRIVRCDLVSVQSQTPTYLYDPALSIEENNVRAIEQQQAPKKVAILRVSRELLSPRGIIDQPVCFQSQADRAASGRIMAVEVDNLDRNHLKLFVEILQSNASSENLASLKPGQLSFLK
ncbi:MAG: hypothetical protein KDB03_19535 [Planctomycetales bacterium]|nr:hypothetical protein [Planctomycetales bacterium]